MRLLTYLLTQYLQLNQETIQTDFVEVSLLFYNFKINLFFLFFFLNNFLYLNGL